MSMLILKNATIVQLYPAKVEKNVDIVIENDEIIATGSSLASRYPWSAGDAGQRMRP